MWPNFFHRQHFQAQVRKPGGTAITSASDSLNPTWKEYFTLPIHDYDDFINFALLAEGRTKRGSSTFQPFMTEMINKLAAKQLIKRSWEISQNEVEVAIGDDLSDFVTRYSEGA